MKFCVLVNWKESHDSSDPFSFFKFWPEKNLKTVVYGASSSRLVNFVERKVLRFNISPLIRARRQIADSDVLFCYSSQVGLPAALWKALCRRSSPRLVLIDIENLARKHRGLMRVFVEFAAKGIDDLICFASFQQSHYEKIRSLACRRTFIPFGYSNQLLPIPKTIAKDGSIVAVGYQDTRFRDWPTLVRAYKKIKSVSPVTGPLVILGRQLPKSLTEGINKSDLVCHKYVPLERFAEVVAPATVCVVPLPDRPLSFGQGSVLTVMGLRKIVITADVAGVRDYVRDGETGFLYDAGDGDSLAAVLERVGRLTSEEAARIEAAAYAAAHGEFSERVMTQRIHDFLFSRRV